MPLLEPKIRICPVMARCDGETIKPTMDACGPCRAYMAKRAKQRPSNLRVELTEYEQRERKWMK